MDTTDLCASKGHQRPDLCRRPHDCLHVSDRRPSNRPDSTAGLLRVWCRHSPQRAERSGDRCRALTRPKQLCKPSPTACIGRFLLKQLQALSNGLYRTIPTYTLTATVSSSHLSAHTSLQRWTRQADGRSRPARAPGAGRVPRADCGVPHTGIQGRHSPNQVAWSRTRLPGAPMRMRGPGSARSTSRPPVPRPGGAGPRLVRRPAHVPRA